MVTKIRLDSEKIDGHLNSVDASFFFIWAPVWTEKSKMISSESRFNQVGQRQFSESSVCFNI